MLFLRFRHRSFENRERFGSCTMLEFRLHRGWRSTKLIARCY